MSESGHIHKPDDDRNHFHCKLCGYCDPLRIRIPVKIGIPGGFTSGKS